MRKYIAMLVAASVAVLAFAALGAGSASALPEFRLTKGGSDGFTGTGGETILRGLLGGFGEVKCTKTKFTGTIESGTMLSKGVVITFEGCKEGTTSCNSTGELSGVIKSNSLTFLVGYTSTTKTRSPVGLLVKPESTTSKVLASYTCGSKSYSVLGEVVGLNSKPNELKTSFVVEFNVGTNGEQLPETFLLLEEETKGTNMTGVHLEVTTGILVDAMGSQSGSGTLTLNNSESGEIVS